MSRSQDFNRYYDVHNLHLQSIYCCYSNDRYLDNFQNYKHWLTFRVHLTLKFNILAGSDSLDVTVMYFRI